jgi:hypothetical protein
MSTDILLNQCGDIKIEDGDTVLVNGADKVRQSWLIHIRTFLGEWFLDENMGVPYLQEIFAKGISKAEVKRILTAATLDVEGVSRVFGVIVGDIDLNTREVEVEMDVEVLGTDRQVFAYSGPVDASVCTGTSDADFPLSVEGLKVWFDALDLGNMTYDPSNDVLELQNKAGSGRATGDGFLDIPKLVGVSPLNNKRAILFDNPLNDGDKQMLQVVDTPAIRGDEFTVIFVDRPVDKSGYLNPQLGCVGLAGWDDIGGLPRYTNLKFNPAPGAGLYNVMQSPGGPLINVNKSYSDALSFEPSIKTMVVRATGETEFFINGSSTGIVAHAAHDLKGIGFGSVGCTSKLVRGFDNISNLMSFGTQTEAPFFRYNGNDATVTTWDSEGYGGDATIVGTGSDPVIGPSEYTEDQAVTFQGAKYFVTPAGSADFTTEDFVFEAVIKPVAGDSGGLIANGYYTNAGFSLHMSGGLPVFVASDGGSFSGVNLTGCTTGAWNHVMVIGDRNGFMYGVVNGAIATIAALNSVGSMNGGLPLYIGTGPGVGPGISGLGFAALHKRNSWVVTSQIGILTLSRYDAYHNTYKQLLFDEFFNGYFGEAQVFDKALDATDLANVHSFLTQKWGF